MSGTISQIFIRGAGGVEQITGPIELGSEGLLGDKPHRTGFPLMIQAKEILLLEKMGEVAFDALGMNLVIDGIPYHHFVCNQRYQVGQAEIQLVRQVFTSDILPWEFSTSIPTRECPAQPPVLPFQQCITSRLVGMAGLYARVETPGIIAPGVEVVEIR